MPSAAQQAADAIIERVLGGAPRPPCISSLGLKLPDGTPGVRLILPGSQGHGEWRQTVAVPLDPEHHARDHAIQRAAQIIGRLVDVRARRLAYAEEVEACDRDPDAGLAIDDDMPIPAARHHCPLVLRTAYDAAGLDDDQRLEHLTGKAPAGLAGATAMVNDVREGSSVDPFHHATRATIEAPGLRWSQGMKQHYLDVQGRMPETVVRGVVGMPVRLLSDAAWLQAPGIVVLAVKRRRDVTRFELSRAYAFAGGTAPAVGHRVASDRNGRDATDQTT